MTPFGQRQILLFNDPLFGFCKSPVTRLALFSSDCDHANRYFSQGVSRSVF